MSYILDALKRSEQERHQGELAHATIDTIMLKAKPVKHHWWPYLLIVVLVLNVCVYVYFQFANNKLSDQKSRAALAPQNSLIQSAEVASVSGSSINQSKMPESQPIVESVENSTELQAVKPLPSHLLKTPSLNKHYDLNQVDAGSESRRLSMHNSQASSEQSKQSKPLFESEFNEDGFEIIRPQQITTPGQNITPEIMQKKQSIPGSEVLSDPHVQNKSGVNAISTVSDIPEHYELIEPARDIPITSQRPVKASETASATQNSEYFEGIQHLSDMSLEFQKTIPDIRFNSHIYSDRPSERRVIINDLYLKEGQGFSGMKIVTIGEFYIELEKQGESFKLPVLRDWFRPN